MSLTPRDIEILSMAMQCLKEPAKVDYAKLMVLGGFKNTASTSAVYNSIKKKLEGLGAVNTSAASTNPKKATPKAKGKPTATMNGDEDADDEDGADEAANSNEDAPMKPAVKKRVSKANMAGGADDATNSNEEMATPPAKPAPRKRAPKAKAAAIKTEDTPDDLADDHDTAADATGTTNGVAAAIATAIAKPASRKRAPKKAPASAIKAEDASPVTDTQDAIASSPTDGSLTLTPAKKRVRKPKDTAGRASKRAKNATVDDADRKAARAARSIIRKNHAQLRKLAETEKFLRNERGGEHMLHEAYAGTYGLIPFGERAHREHPVRDMSRANRTRFAENNSGGEDTSSIDDATEEDMPSVGATEEDLPVGEALEEDMPMDGALEMDDGGA